MTEESNGVGFMLSAMKESITSRHHAADVLRKVAEDGQYGCYPEDVLPEELGQAIWRIFMNCNAENALPRLINSLLMAEADFRRRCEIPQKS